jgi:HAMP domain-containing protein
MPLVQSFLASMIRCQAAAATTAEAMRSKKEPDRPALLSDIIVPNAEIGALTKAVEVLMEEVDKIKSGQL